MSYELESFGIRTVLVEHGVIKINFTNSTMVEKKSQYSNSSYPEFMKSMEKLYS